MIHLPISLKAWGSSEFTEALKQEFEQLDPQHLPLQQALSHSSHVTDRPFQAMILSAHEESGLIQTRIGVFYTGVVAGCNCADDPSPVDEQTEYCVIRVVIDRVTAATTVTLLAE